MWSIALNNANIKKTSFFAKFSFFLRFLKWKILVYFKLDFILDLLLALLRFSLKGVSFRLINICLIQFFCLILKTLFFYYFIFIHIKLILDNLWIFKNFFFIFSLSFCFGTVKNLRVFRLTHSNCLRMVKILTNFRIAQFITSQK